MHTLTIIATPCEACRGDRRGCIVVCCPRAACRAVRYLDHWEVYDDFAICPACDESVDGYEPINGNKFICRRVVEQLVAAEEEAAKRKPRKPRTKKEVTP
jgi:hypothetical protein